MSSNFFAALDDSGDEGPAPSKAAKPVENKKETKPKPQAKVVEASKVDPKKRPNQGDRNTKYGRGGRAPARDGKRQYDRRSGTGRGREVKKGGGGARNWGSDKNEAREAEGHVDEDAVVPPAVDAADGTEAKEDVTENQEGMEVTPEAEPEPEPEDKTMSYEEYLAKKANPDNEAFKPVKEREVENEFAGMKLAKKEVDEDFLKVGGGKQKKVKQKKVTPKETIALDFRIASSTDDDRRNDGSGRGGRDGRGRGRGGRDGRDGRGGGRGGRDGGRGGRDGGRGGRDGGRGGRDGRGRGGGRGGRAGGRTSGGDGGGRGLNVMDESAFPSLG